MDEGYVPVKGGRLYYQLSGTGPVVTFLHAGIADHRMWDDQFHVFANRYQVVGYDARGYGRSSIPEAEYSLHEDLMALLEYLGVARTALIGSSMGGSTAIDFTLAHPPFVTALVPVAAGLSGYPWEADQHVRKNWEEAQVALKAGDIETVVELSLRTWIDGPRRRPEDVSAGVRTRAREMLQDTLAKGEIPLQPSPLQPPAAERMGEIRVPTLTVVGDEDVDAIFAIAETIAQSIPGAQRTVMHGVAHLPNMESPEEFNGRVLEFLSRVL